MARLLVTGGSGFIGTNLIEHHLQKGDEILNFDIAEPRNAAHRFLWQRGDLLDRRSLAAAIDRAQPDFVYHMGARTDLHGASITDYPANTQGVTNLIEALREYRKIRSVVFASSMLVCRIGYRPQHEQDYCPSTAYGESKIEGERTVRRMAAGHFPWVIVRPTSIWGPWFDAPYRDFFNAVSRGLYVHPAGRRIRRNYGFVLNSVAQLERLTGPEGQSLMGRTIYLADYEPIELKSWAESIQLALQSAPVREMPMWVFRLAAVAGDVLKKCGYKLPPMSSYRLNNMLTEMIHDTGPLEAICPELPYSIEQGVSLTCNWLRGRRN